MAGPISPSSAPSNGLSMTDIAARLARLEERSNNRDEQMTAMNANVAAMAADVKQLTAAYHVSKGYRILGQIGLTAVAGAIGASLSKYLGP